MASVFSYQLLLRPVPFSLYPGRCSSSSSVSHRTKFLFFSRDPAVHRCGESVIAMMGMGALFPDFESSSELARELLSRVEGVIYTVSDAAVSSSYSTTTTVAEEASKQSSDWLSGITNSLETVLKILKDGLSTLHVPYAYGFAIILLTIIVKAATFPLTKKQVESALAMKSLQPQVKAIQQHYAGDQERIQIETARLYKLAGVNPLAGCLPTLATVPIWIGLYRALSNVANEGLLNEGFFWIPSLSGPTTIAARQSGSGTSWLFPFVDGHPPLGWLDTLAYLVLPVFLIVSQYVSTQIMQPSQSNDPREKSSQAVLKFIPLMIGYFALSVPSGLSLYWLTNNILSTAQQIWLQKLGGAKNPVRQFGDEMRKDEASKILKSLSDLQRSTIAETENLKPTAGPNIDSPPRRGERFKQITEEEARRRKQKEEISRSIAENNKITASLIGCSCTETGEQKAPNECEVKTDNEKSEGYFRSKNSSMKTTEHLNHSSKTVNSNESFRQGVEKESQELHAASGFQKLPSDSINSREEQLEKDEV